MIECAEFIEMKSTTHDAVPFTYGYTIQFLENKFLTYF